MGRAEQQGGDRRADRGGDEARAAQDEQLAEIGEDEVRADQALGELGGEQHLEQVAAGEPGGQRKGIAGKQIGREIGEQADGERDQVTLGRQAQQGADDQAVGRPEHRDVAGLAGQRKAKQSGHQGGRRQGRGARQRASGEVVTAHHPQQAPMHGTVQTSRLSCS